MTRQRVTLVALTLAVVAVSMVASDQVAVQTYPIAPSSHNEANYTNENTFIRTKDGSIDMQMYENFIIKKYRETLALLDKICHVNDVNGCAPYRLRAQDDLKKFFQSLGTSVKFFDTYLIQYRKNRANRRRTTKAPVTIKATEEPKTTAIPTEAPTTVVPTRQPTPAAPVTPPHPLVRETTEPTTITTPSTTPYNPYPIPPKPVPVVDPYAKSPMTIIV